MTVDHEAHIMRPKQRVIESKKRMFDEVSIELYVCNYIKYDKFKYNMLPNVQTFQLKPHCNNLFLFN